ncbi:MAG TPA: 50S ribosomal protein L10 [Chromatiales bacterium]|nr:50S ribosomal protein L10 [Thiotrichales bacterium]HIP68968.1 50S ribosomal protein L10 [Chromatiales bacterium]
MALRLEDKKQVVSEVAAVAADAHSVIAAEYAGLTVEELTDLRKKARDGGVYLRVVKNTLARRAFEGTDYECMREGLVGPLMLAFSQEDPGAAARVLKDFSDDNEKLNVKLISIGGELLDASELKRLASLPTYDQAISMLMALMKAPVEKLARTLNEVPGKLVRTVAAVRDDKQAAG